MQIPILIEPSAGNRFQSRGGELCTPRPVLQKLNAEVGKIVSRADVRAEWARQGAAPLAMGPDEFSQYLRDDIEKWARIVRISGARADQ